MNRLLYILIFFLGIILYIFSDKNVYNPKPYGYKKLDIPENSYVKFPYTDFPYEFEISKYATVERVIENQLGNYCINIKYPDFNANLQITYKSFTTLDELRDYIKISKSLAYYHKVKSNKITEELMESSNGNHYVLIKIFGESPTKLQFFTTDEKNHFIRGAIYFDEDNNDEYLSPITKFLLDDILNIMDTLFWKNI